MSEKKLMTLAKMCQLQEEIGGRIDQALAVLKKDKNVAKFVEVYVQAIRELYGLYSGILTFANITDLKILYQKEKIAEQSEEYFEIIEVLLNEYKRLKVKVLPLLVWSNFLDFSDGSKYQLHLFPLPTLLKRHTPATILKAFELHDLAVDEMNKVAVN